MLVSLQVSKLEGFFVQKMLANLLKDLMTIELHTSPFGDNYICVVPILHFCSSCVFARSCGGILHFF